MTKQLIEDLAALDHDRWVKWSQQICEEESISLDRLARWQSYWVPYSELPEDIKENNRKAAKVVIEVINKNDVQQIHTKLVGVTFEGRQDNIDKIKAGQFLPYVHERDNPYDSNSIHVFESIEGKMSLGHLKRNLAFDVVQARERGMRVRIQVSGVTGGDGPKSKGVNVIVLIDKV